ncbi:MAG TPA: HipA domain-containing protein [Mucilaginibacter sp.]|nr:HipA domain-containing protein [Mucilaginibacter sp.]
MVTSNTTDIWVFAHWKGMQEPKLVGILTAQQAKGRKSFSFQYDNNWMDSREKLLLDPDIGWYGGPQFPEKKQNFGIFTDSMPDTWGRKLMQRKAAHIAKTEGKRASGLYEVDYLLGVHDFTRMGALRFKTDPSGPFLDNDPHRPAPPWTSIRELQYSARSFEHDVTEEEERWIESLFAPGSSLGGARPKANIVDDKGELWIAKFPSRNDTIDKANWEYLAHMLAIQSGIQMSDCRLENVYGDYNTFFTKRFDRSFSERIHFSSAMTMTGYHEELIKDYNPSYLEIAEFIQHDATASKEDLQQLWRRIIFNIAVSNTDDHLRNHGFLLSDKGWRLSPAYDLNPSTDKTGLGLNIDLDSNDLDLDLAKSVGEYFQLNNNEMNHIIEDVRAGTSNWREHAQNINIPRQEQEQMAAAFTFDNQRPIQLGYNR